MKMIDDMNEDVLPLATSPLTPQAWPACARCHQAYTLRRNRMVWAWFPDCNHKTSGVIIVTDSTYQVDNERSNIRGIRPDELGRIP